MAEIWCTLAEVQMQRGDLEGSGRFSGFMHIVAWAEDERSLLDKLNSYFSEYSWHLLETENTRQLDISDEHPDELQVMIDDVLTDPTRIRLGTFHTYAEN